MSDSAATVLVLGQTSLTTSIAAEHLEANSSAEVMDCGSDTARLLRVLSARPVDAVVIFSNSDDEFLEFLADELETVIARASAASCPVFVSGVSERLDGLLSDAGRDVHGLSREAPLDRLWEELEEWAGVECQEEMCP